MDDFGMLARDFGYRPQGKSAPIKSDGGDYRSTRPQSSSSFTSDENQIFNDAFGGPPKFTNSNSRSTSATSDIDYDLIFRNSSSTNTNNEAKSKSDLPVYVKPVYDDNIFASMTGSLNKQNDHLDDLLGNLGRTEKVEPPKHNKSTKSPRGFDDLLPGFGSGGPASSIRSNSDSAPVSTNNTKETSTPLDDPFVVLESTSTPATSSFIDPPETIHKVSRSGSTNDGGSSVGRGMFDDIDPLHGFGTPAPAFSSETNNKKKDQSPSKSSTRRDPTEKSSSKYSESQSQKVPVYDFQESQQPVFDMPPVSPPSYTDTSFQADMSSKSEEHVQPADDIWLTVSEIHLFTHPTRAPPPSRPPPPIPRLSSKSGRGYFGNDYPASSNSAKYSQRFNPFQSAAKSPTASSSPLDEFKNFAMGGAHNNGENNGDAKYGEEIDSNSASAAMQDAMDRAEAKFRHAKEVREREYAKASRIKESVKLQGDEMSSEEESERQQREREEQQREKNRLEREKGRHAVERATREARERAASEVCERASAEARLKAERAAVQRAQAEARERAAIDAKGRAERAAAEARELASAEASERAAAEAREKAAQEKAAVARTEVDARRRAERAVVDRVNAEARERAATDARDRAAAARMNPQKTDNDFESFFSSRPSSAPTPRATSSDSAPDPLSQNRRGQEGRASSNMRNASSATNIVDDLRSIFGAAPSSAGMFQDVEGETEERRRARLERQQRTQERTAKALAEKNNRDLQSQREQEERNRIGETLDIEIKHWATGKEGNLRALLSTLQYVLWSGCGWQPVSLTDLITGANVKKAYRKATLCIHPDKVQQKGANLQQKYVAEKVFDLLKEAWNKFNSEELF